MVRGVTDVTGEQNEKDQSRAAAKNSGAKVAKKVAPKQTSAGRARAEGLRLFKLAGRPTKEQVVHVFGKPGVAWTWVARAKALGVKSAEEVARRFPELLKRPTKSCLVTKAPSQSDDRL